MSDLKSPLAKARGLGSAHDGVHHWIHQRITALALIPLTIWFVYSIVALIGVPHHVFTQWLSQPINAILMILVVIAIFYHAALGCQVVAEDYIHCKASKLATLIGLKLFFLAAGIACVFSILKVAL